jgi:high-affinity K+ transport system ATPase subunit B
MVYSFLEHRERTVQNAEEHQKHQGIQGVLARHDEIINGAVERIAEIMRAPLVEMGIQAGPRDATAEEIAADDLVQDAKADAREEARDDRVPKRRRK